MKRTILIVDDIRSNREILKNILHNDYDVMEAAHGQEAIALMTNNYQQISAVLLDLGMPVMDGYEVLEYTRKDERLAQIPIIVTTGQMGAESEERALLLGANDYISKPYKTSIIKQRIANTINLRETAAAINELQRDRLTGLLNATAFYQRTGEMIATHEAGYYCMACFDIDSFKVVNDQYGNAIGDEVLKHIANCIRTYVGGIGGICSRINADNFAVLYPSEYMGSPELEGNHAEASNPPCLDRPLGLTIGRYLVNDFTLPPSAMFDRAVLAKESVKGRYDQHIALYDESMRDRLLYEQKIVTQMEDALAKRQFEVWFQPQYNHSSGALIGAEALVRWRHPENGLILPGQFVSVFEKNGFIYELDKFVWEESCRCLREWMDKGRSLLPLSVNISRYDIFRSDFLEVIKGLVGRYDIPVDLLRLEITESAFAESTNRIVEVVKELITFGFTLEIDDFGSGYSSLNTLKNVPAQVVKLDMRFLDDDDDTMRGGNILESIVRMTKWLGMSVIAEGVEEIEQADFLKSIGCNYVQGYLYARPMPLDDYVALFEGTGKEEKLITLETVENLDNNRFWNPKSMDTLIFNSYIGNACIFEYCNGKIELLRASDKYVNMLGIEGFLVEDVLKLRWEEHLAPEDIEKLTAELERSAATGEEVTSEYIFHDISSTAHETFLRSTFRVIAKTGSRFLVYCTNENITAQRKAEQREREAARMLKSVMDNVNCGITAATIIDGKFNFILVNDKFYELLGYTKEEYIAEALGNPNKTVFSEDQKAVKEISRKALETGVEKVAEYRAWRRDGSIIWLHSTFATTKFEDIDEPVQLCTYSDITSEKQAAQDLLDNLPGGAALFEYDGEKLKIEHINKRYWELVGRIRLDLSDCELLDAVYPDDVAVIMQSLKDAMRAGTDAACDIRILNGESDYRPFHVVARIVPKSSGIYSVYVFYTPISDEEMDIKEMLPIALNAMMNEQMDYSYVKDQSARYICCSRPMAQLAGLSDETQIVGKTAYDFFEKPLADKFTADDERVMTSGESLVNFEEAVSLPNGTLIYLNTSKFPLHDSHGNIIGVYSVSQDITEVRETRSHLELVTSNIPGGIAVYEGDTTLPGYGMHLTYFNDGFNTLFGYSREEYEALAATNPLCLVFEEDMPALAEQIQRLVVQNVRVDNIYRAHVKGGGYKWINLKATLSEREGNKLTAHAILLDVTDRQEMVERLRLSEEENRLAIQHSKSVVCRYTIAEKSVTVSPRVDSIFGLPEIISNVPEGPIANNDISKDTIAAYSAMFERVNQGDREGLALYQRWSSVGWRWIEAHFSTLFSAEDKPISAVLSLVDVSDRFEKEAVYKKWQQSLQEKKQESFSMYRCDVSKDAFLEFKKGSLLDFDFKQGHPGFDEQIASFVMQCVVAEDQQALLAFLKSDSMIASYHRGKRVDTIEFCEILKDEEISWRRLTVELVEYFDSKDIEAFLLFEDIDEEKRSSLAVLELAQTDSLTGVHNRATFEAQVNRLMKNSPEDVQNALLMLDIDGFKQVNDSFGHSVGDQLLVDIVGSLRYALRRGDLLGRLGGDEFGIFLRDVPSDSIIANKAKQICDLMRKTFNSTLSISGSVGIAVNSRDGSDFDTLYKKADEALYFVKDSGKDNYAFFREDIESDDYFETQDDVSASITAQRLNERRRMLIVDDSRIDHALMANIFSDEFIIDKAQNGKAAMIRLRHYGSAISVVLLDLMMPGMDGFAVMNKMQESDELRSIPVIVVSSSNDYETSLKTIECGAADFVTKPVDPDLIRIRVRSAIAKAENERQRALSSIQEFENNELSRYRIVLERSGMFVIELNWISGVYTYESIMSKQIAGIFDNRKLWHILLSDMVADTETVKKLQVFVHELAEDRQRMNDIIYVQLRTPTRELHWFKVGVYKVNNEFGLTGIIYLVFFDLGENFDEGGNN